MRKERAMKKLLQKRPRKLTGQHDGLTGNLSGLTGAFMEIAVI